MRPRNAQTTAGANNASGANGTERVALVTGGTEGIGRAVALELARSGDRVLFVGRDPQRGQRVLEELRAAAPARDHAFLRADLSLLTETARVADDIARLTPRLDAAVFCAGILSFVPEWTAEGLERNFVLNYLSRYLLARLMLPLLDDSLSGRLVLVASAGVYKDTLDFRDLQHRNGKRGLDVSGRTQFANDLLAVELAERLRGTRIEATCVFPGVTKTGVFRNACGLPWLLRRIAPLVLRLRGQSPEASAQTPVFLARDPHAIGSSGGFFGPRCERRTVPTRVLRPERRLALWEASENLVRPFLPKAESRGFAA